MAKKSKKPIEIDPARKGKFRKLTGTKKGKDIPLKKEEKELHSKDPEVRKEANFAINARKWSKGKKK